MSDLEVCRVMHWTYDELLSLPADVHAVLMEHLNAQARAQAAAADDAARD